MVKSTYSLDLETVNALEQLARRLGLSKSEALRRVIRQAAGQLSQGRQEALDALTRVQQALSLSPAQVERWARQARAEREGSSAKRMTKRMRAVR